MKNNQGKYILLVEGSVPLANEGFCMIGGKSSQQILKESAAGAAAIVAWGSCASHGCVQAANPNPTGATPIHKLVNKPVINVPGCPPVAEVMTAVVTHLLLFNKIPELDSAGRPKEFYSRRVHDTCYRRPYYDAGLFVEAWDDEAARKGYCLYKMGCRGPVTYNACSVTKWNGNLSYPIQSGHGCIGCSEAGFWDNGPFYQHLPAFPGFGIESTADTIGATAAAVTVGGIALHAITSNILKRKVISEHLKESVIVERKEAVKSVDEKEKGGEENGQSSS
jgi:hydrogenase small subunit